MNDQRSEVRWSRHLCRPGSILKLLWCGLLVAYFVIVWNWAAVIREHRNEQEIARRLARAGVRTHWRSRGPRLLPDMIRYMEAFERVVDVDMSGGTGVSSLCRYVLSLSEVEFLRADNSDLNDADLLSFASLEHLQYVSLSDTDVGENVSAIASMKSMKDIDLRRTRVNDEVMKKCSFGKNVRFLDLSETLIGNETAGLLSKATGLMILEIDDTSVDDDGLMQLASLKKLTVVSAVGTKITQAGVASFKKRQPDCSVLIDQ